MESLKMFNSPEYVSMKIHSYLIVVTFIRVPNIGKRSTNS